MCVLEAGFQVQSHRPIILAPRRMHRGQPWATKVDVSLEYANLVLK